ncbi:MAG: hypothetical protein ACLVEJ_10515 [Parabacteroides sp.]
MRLPVFSHDLSEEEYGYACSLPEDSIHLLSNYYNYTLSKATYRYAMKIDADQIYFPERMIRLCDAYRSLPVKKKDDICLPGFWILSFIFVSEQTLSPILFQDVGFPAFREYSHGKI